MLRADSPDDAATIAALVSEQRLDELPQGFRAGGDPQSAVKLIRSAENEGQRDWMARNPEHPRSKLDRYVIVHYDSVEAAEAAAESLQREPTVQFAYASGGDESGSEPGGEPGGDPPIEGTPNRWHLNAVNAPAAWALQTSWIPVGVMDSGLDTNHPKFLPFIGNTYNGGNWVRGLSRDIVNQSANDPTTIDEDEDEDHCVLATPLVGHGTHVAGLVAASNVGNQNAVGVCHDCSLLVTKRSRCVGDPSNSPALLSLPDVGSLFAASVTHQVDFGASVVNYSGAVRPDLGGTLRYMSAGCLWSANQPECLALSYAQVREVAVVAASGNFPKSSMGFPASDVRTIAVSGAELEGSMARNWLRVGPNRLLDGKCPTMPAPGDPVSSSMEGCGGSARWGGVFGNPGYTLPPNTTFFPDRNYWPHDRAPEFIASAYLVYSTFYLGGIWIGPNALPFHRSCTDANDAVPLDRFGFCTGTSMAAPVIAGVAGLVRSTNPHLKVGVRDRLVQNGLGYLFATGYAYRVDRIPTTGLRKLMAEVSSIPSPAIKPAPHWITNTPVPSDDDIHGSGLPNAELAVKAALGVVDGSPLLNRVTPAYYMYSATQADRAVVSVPQQRWALEFSGYANGYGQVNVHQPLLPQTFSDPYTGHEPDSRGGFYVFTTAAKPVSSWPASMLPIFLIDRSPGFPGAQDLSWAVGQVDLTTKVNSGWDYFGRQGYLAPAVNSFFGPTCSYDNRLTLVRRVCSAIDCAIVLEADVASMAGAGYSDENVALGCAIKNVDTDGDQIPDGFESIAGLSPTNSDTDGDGCSDLDEYPYGDLQTSDPAIAGDCP